MSNCDEQLTALRQRCEHLEGENRDFQIQVNTLADELARLQIMAQYSELLKERAMLLALLTAVNDYRHVRSAAESGADVEAAVNLNDSYVNVLLKADMVEAYLEARSI